MNFRASFELRSRAWTCADAIDEPLADFVKLCVRFGEAGKLDGVVIDEKMTSTTRADSTIISVPRLEGEGSKVREWLARGVVFAEARMPKPLAAEVLADIAKVNAAEVRVRRRMVEIGGEA